MDLHEKCHYARAANKFSAAVAAAQALDQADCLFTARLQAEEANTWMSHAVTSGVTNEDGEAALVRALQLLNAAIPTMERRMAAGTLLAGACWPLEEAWFAARLNLSEVRREQSSDRDWQVQFVGYQAYLQAAQAALRFAMVLARSGVSEHAQRLVTFTVSAVDLMVQPRCHGDKATSAELILFRILRLTRDANIFEPYPTPHHLLEDAWERL